MGTIRIGVSGWNYPDWRGTFYPSDVPKKRELEYAAGCFGTLEVNGSFYSLQRASTYEGWRERTPEGTVLALKGPQFITHMKRLRDPATPLANFFASGPLALREKLGPVLWQLPPQLTFDAARVGEFLAGLPRTTTAAAALAAGHDQKVSDEHALTTADAERPLRHAVEVRHESFADEEALALFREHGVAVVVASSDGRWPLLEEPTADFCYVRLHGDTELYTSQYGEHALRSWAGKLVRWRDQGLDVYAYFDNDAQAHAPHDAMALRERCGLG